MKYKHSSIQDLIYKSLICYKDKNLFNHKINYRSKSMTGKELYEKISALQIFFNNKGIKKGNKIIILAPPSLEWVIVYFACILSNVIVIPLDILTNKELLEKINNQVKAKAIFQHSSINLHVKKTQNFYVDNLSEILDKIKYQDIKIVKANTNDFLEIQYTSGTTGDPKGVILTHKNIFAAVQSAVSSFNIRIKIRLLNMLPLSHVFAQIMGVFLPLNFGYQVFFIDNIKPKKIIFFIRNKKIHAAIMVPGILSALKNELQEKSVSCSLGIQFRLIGVGGASLDKDLERWYRKKMIFILQGYGLTETSSIVSMNKLFASRVGSTGKIINSVDIKLNQDNEILVKGDNVTIGYYKNESKTKESFEKGWFKTGDIGEIKNNYLYIKERKKDIIVTSSGLKAYPIDIESVLNSFKEVKESCVIQKDGKIHAILILKEKANIENLIKDANSKLLSHQQIASYSLWPYNEFPKTSTGKVKKYILLQESSTAKNYENIYEDKFYNLIQQTLKPERKIKKNSKLVDLGMDSLKRVELISNLENGLGIEVDEAQLNQKITIAELEKLIKETHIHNVRFKIWPTNALIKALRFFYQRILLFPFIRFFTKTEYKGLEYLSDIKEPVIFVSNHQSAFDVPLIIKHIRVQCAIAADSEVIFGIGTKRFSESILRRILGYYSEFAYNAYPFGTTIGIDTSLEFTGEMLDKKYSIILFPEGERTLDGKIHEFKQGIGYIVANMQVSVIPLKINGLFYVLPRSKTIPKFGKTNVTFGKMIKFDKNKLFEMTYKEIASLIEEKVRELE